METNKYLLRDDDEGFYNVIFFTKKINVEKLEELIRKHKKENIGEWNIGSISEEIKKEFPVKRILYFDYMINNTGNICGDANLEYVEEN